MGQLAMVDCAVDARTLPARALTGAAVVGRYLGTGGGAATPLSRSEAAWLLGRGLAVWPIFNDSTVDGGDSGSYELGAADARLAIAQADALGVPDGVFVAGDIERNALQKLGGGYIAGWADGMRAGRLGGAGVLYANLIAQAFGQAFDEALVLSPDNVNRLGFWDAAWLSTGEPPASAPSFADTVARLPWQAAHKAQVWARQYAGGAAGGLVDLSVLFLPWPTIGREGLWYSPGVGFPAA
jgi:hypothetical protein